MRERAKEEKNQRTRDEAAADVHAKIAELPEPDRARAQRLHELITAAAPELAPRTYYGMPAYTRNGKVVVFFKPARSSSPLRDPRLRAGGASRRRLDVAHLVRADGADKGRRAADRRPREAGRELSAPRDEGNDR